MRKIEFMLKNISKKVGELVNYKIGNINIGELSKRNHAHYFKGKNILKDKYEIEYRRIFEASILIYKSFYKILKKFNDYDLFTANGKFIQTAIPSLLNKELGNDFYTYEVFSQGNAVIFDKNKCSLEQRLDEVWNELKILPLNKKEKDRLYHSFELQEKSLSSPHQLWDNKIITEDDQVIKDVGIDKNKIVIICFTHVYWDSTHMGIKAVSKDMMSWLEQMIKFVNKNKNFQLIIRSHPLKLKYQVTKKLKQQFKIILKKNLAYYLLMLKLYHLKVIYQVTHYQELQMQI